MFESLAQGTQAQLAPLPHLLMSQRYVATRETVLPSVEDDEVEPNYCPKFM